MYKHFFYFKRVCIQVIDGNDVLDKMEGIAVDESYRPLRDIKIEKISIHANPLAG